MTAGRYLFRLRGQETRAQSERPPGRSWVGTLGTSRRRNGPHAPLLVGGGWFRRSDGLEEICYDILAKGGADLAAGEVLEGVVDAAEHPAAAGLGGGWGEAGEEDGQMPGGGGGIALGGPDRVEQGSAPDDRQVVAANRHGDADGLAEAVGYAGGDDGVAHRHGQGGDELAILANGGPTGVGKYLSDLIIESIITI